MSPQEHDAILLHLEYIKAAVDGTNTRLDVQNGRIRVVEQAVAVLEDRQTDARASGRRWGAGAGAFVGGVIVAVYQYFGGNK